jgi:hypothetical protein
MIQRQHGSISICDQDIVDGNSLRGIEGAHRRRTLQLGENPKDAYSAENTDDNKYSTTH